MRIKEIPDSKGAWLIVDDLSDDEMRKLKELLREPGRVEPLGISTKKILDSVWKHLELNVCDRCRGDINRQGLRRAIVRGMGGGGL